MRSLSRSSTGSSTSGSGSGYTASTVNVEVNGFCSGLPARSWMLFVGIVRVYVCPSRRGVVVVMVSLLPFIVMVLGLIKFTLLFHSLMLLYVVPGCMFSLKVMVIILFMSIPMVLLAGSMLVMAGTRFTALSKTIIRLVFIITIIILPVMILILVL